MNLKDVANLLESIRDFRLEDGSLPFNTVDYHSIEDAIQVCLDVDKMLESMDTTRLESVDVLTKLEKGIAI